MANLLKSVDHLITTFLLDRQTTSNVSGKNELRGLDTTLREQEMFNFRESNQNIKQFSQVEEKLNLLVWLQDTELKHE